MWNSGNRIYDYVHSFFGVAFYPMRYAGITILYLDHLVILVHIDIHSVAHVQMNEQQMADADMK